MRHLVAAVVAACLVMATIGAVPAAARAASPVCLTLEGAPPDATAEQLTAGIRDGSITIVAVGGACGAPQVSGPASGDTGAWIVGEIANDPITDQPSVDVILPADGSSGMSMTIRCRDGETDLIIEWAADISSSVAQAYILTRLDGAEPEREPWFRIPDSTSTSLMEGDDIPFITKLLGATHLVARNERRHGEPLTAEFTLSGIGSAIAPVREACGW